MKFIHMADIHLDSPFTLEDSSRSEQRRSELRQCYASVFEFIRGQEIPLCLISGDIFESDYATPDTVAFIVSQFETCPNCEFVVAPGNHDPYTKSSVYATASFPNNVYIFKKSEMSYFDFPNLGVTVYGWAFTSGSFESNPLIGFEPGNKERINLLCAHADVGNGLSHYCPLGEKDIAASGLDYAALGHIHMASKNTDCPVAWGYSGCLVGRDYGEPGQKGVFVCEVSKEGGYLKLDISPKRFSRNQYADETINVTGASSNADIIRAVSELLDKRGYSTDTLLRVTITGSVSPSFTIKENEIRSNFASRLYSFDLRDHTVPNFDVTALEKDLTIRGEFYRTLAPKLTEGTEEERAIAAEALRYGLCAIDGNDFTNF